MAFSLKNMFSKTTAKELQTDQFAATVTSAGAVIGQRTPQNPAIIAGYTPERVANILAAAETGEPSAIREMFALADKVVERDLHAAGVINGLVLAVTGLSHKVLPAAGNNSLRARKIAEDVQALFHASGALRLAAPGIVSSGLTHSLGPAAIEWDTSGTTWRPLDFIQKPCHFFTYDRVDSRTPLLLPAVAGQPPTAIEPGTAIMFTPRRHSAIQIKNGLAWLLCWAYVIKALVDADKLSFLANFGQPIVIGEYSRNANPEDVSLLRQAVSAINSTFRAAMRDDLKIRFEQVARTGTDMYENVARLMDEYTSKIVWSSTLVSDSGSGSGSYALGKVHAEGKYDVVRAIAHQWAATLQRDVVEPYVLLNYGPDAPMPILNIDVEEDEDLVAGSTIVKNLVDAGVALVASEVRAKFGFTNPQEGDEVIGGAPAPSDPSANAPEHAKNARQLLDLGQGCPVHASNARALPATADAIDGLSEAALSDWLIISRNIDTSISQAAQSASDLPALRGALASLVEKMDVESLQLLLASANTKARAAGDLGADI